MADPCKRAAHAAHPPDALRGDVDGDGKPESVGLVRVAKAPRRCRLRLVAGDGIQAAAIPYDGGPAGPFVNGLAAVDGRPGLDVVVTVDQGASTAFATVFSVRARSLVRLRRPAYPSGEFAYEGSVTHLDAVDCVRHGIVASSWTPVGGLERRYYRARGTSFLLAGVERVRRAKNPFRYREFRGRQPFPHCLAVRSR